jgi:hypothetical protein
VLQLPFSLSLAILQVISEISKVRVNVSIGKCSLFVVTLLGLEINVIVVLFSVSDLDEVLAWINTASLVG